MKNKTLSGYIAIIIAMAIWSFTFIWTKEILESNACTPLTIIVARLVISVLLMFPYALIFRQFEKIDRKDILLLTVLGILQPFIYFIGETFGQMTVSPTVTSVVISTIPLFTPFAVAFFYKEKVVWTNIVGIVVSFVGVYMLLIRENMEIIVDPKGLALLFLAVISAVFYSAVIHKLVGRYKPLTILMWQNAIGLACYIPWFAFTDLGSVISKGIPFAYIDNLLLLGVLGSTVAYLLFIYSVKAITIWLVNAFANLIPVLTAFFAYLVLGEKLLPVGMAGVGVAILGLFISQIRSKPAASISENY